METPKKPNKKRVCPNCGRHMVQQFIGLKHCKCGISWKKDVGYFERAPDMVFALQRQVTKKGKNSVRTKQVPTIRYNNKAKADPYSVFDHDGNKYLRIKVGSVGDFYEDGDTNTHCTDCGAQYDHYHNDGCDCERCPMCGGQLLTCGCNTK